MADYTVTILDRSPGYVVLRYVPSVMPVTITLSDLPTEPMELAQIQVTLDIDVPSNVTFYIVEHDTSMGDLRLGSEDGVTFVEGYNYILMVPGISQYVSGRNRVVPVAPLPLTKATQLRLFVGGTYEADYTVPHINVVARCSLPRRVDDLITRTTYRDADGYIIS